MAPRSDSSVRVTTASMWILDRNRGEVPVAGGDPVALSHQSVHGTNSRIAPTAWPTSRATPTRGGYPRVSGNVAAGSEGQIFGLRSRPQLQRARTGDCFPAGPQWLEDGSFRAAIEDRATVRIVVVHPDGSWDDVVEGQRLITGMTARRDGSAMAMISVGPTDPGELVNGGKTASSARSPNSTPISGPPRDLSTFSTSRSATTAPNSMRGSLLPPGIRGKVPPLAQHAWWTRNAVRIRLLRRVPDLRVGRVRCGGVQPAWIVGSGDRLRPGTRGSLGRGASPGSRGHPRCRRCVAWSDSIDSMPTAWESWGGLVRRIHDRTHPSARSQVEVESIARAVCTHGPRLPERPTSDSGFPQLPRRLDLRPLGHPVGRQSALPSARRSPHRACSFIPKTTSGAPSNRPSSSLRCSSNAGVEAEMLRFPGSGHELSRSGKPKYRRERFEAIIDWHRRHLGSDTRNHMVTPTPFVWFNGNLVPRDEAECAYVLSHGLHYGSGVFEGIRASATSSGPAAFRLTDHMKPPGAWGKGVPYLIPWSPAEFVTAARDLVWANGSSTLSDLRPIVFYGTGTIGVNPLGAEVDRSHRRLLDGCLPRHRQSGTQSRGRVSSWRRVDHESLIPNAKGAGQYLNSMLALLGGNRRRCDEALMLNGAGYVAEGTGENLFLVRDGVVRTPSTAPGILDGFTRARAIELLADDGLSVVEDLVTRSDLYYVDEAFLTGTEAEVTPICEIDDRAGGSGAPGPVTRRFQSVWPSSPWWVRTRHTAIGWNSSRRQCVGQQLQRFGSARGPSAIHRSSRLPQRWSPDRPGDMRTPGDVPRGGAFGNLRLDTGCRPCVSSEVAYSLAGEGGPSDVSKRRWQR